MNFSRGVLSSETGYLEALRAKRAVLKEHIREARKNPAANSEILALLKRENVRLKDQEAAETLRRA